MVSSSIAFALKSSRYLKIRPTIFHLFACSETDGKFWVEKILVACVSPFPLFHVFSRASFVFLFHLFGLMFSSKNDMSYSTRRTQWVIPLVSLVPGPPKRRLKDYPIKTFRNRFLFSQNNSKKFLPFLRAFKSSHPFFSYFLKI